MRDPAAVRRIVLFIAVGCVAAAVHWGIVVGLVVRAGWHPLLANGVGWAVAFVVSFVGHHRFTFGGHGQQAGIAAARLLVVSAAGFGVNEAAYALLLHTTGLRFDIALAVVLVAVAAVTYVLGRHWVFRRSPAPP